MTKKFENLAEDGSEKALRRGFTVPNGAVNIAWVKAPALAPSNNVVVIDTSKVVAENQAVSGGTKTKLAFANGLGVLEDVYGNYIWDEEYPVISDVLLTPADEFDKEDYHVNQILPFLHVSRYFHLDFGGLATGQLEYHDKLDIRIVDKDGVEHLDADGKQRYKIYLIEPNVVDPVKGSRQSAYRIYAFIDMDPDADELYLSYYKVELNKSGGFKELQQNFKERVNPRSYFKYVPEESDVFDLTNQKEKIYSSKPATMKDQIIGTAQSNAFGWKYTVPRKALPDPRIFQLFRWRLACEFTQVQNTTLSSDGSSVDVSTGVIRAGVVIPSGGDHNSTRANFFFYQLNESDYNFSKIRFVNPINSPTLSWTRTAQQAASYWHVDLANIDYDTLGEFDVLIWAPNSINQLTTEELVKAKYFTETVGGTFIYETSSITDFSNMLTHPVTTPPMVGTVTTDLYTTAASLRLKDNTPADTTDTFDSLGAWKKWPPNVSDILNNYNDIGSILTTADVIAGWDLSAPELANLSGYEQVINSKFQYFMEVPTGFTAVAEAQQYTTGTYQPTLLHKKYNSGGNLFLSTARLFEDHLINPNGTMATKSLNIANISQLSRINQDNFKAMVSSPPMAGEMKLRFNIMLFATINKPSPVKSIFNKHNFVKSNNQSTTVYGDWESTWVINPANGVLSDKEKAESNFALLPTQADDLIPVWQRVLSNKTLEQIIKDKIKKIDPLDKDPILKSLESATRRYFIMVTNPLVKVSPSEFLSNNDLPTAWTTAYSPAFKVPTYLGSYVVRDEMIAGTGVGEGKRIYPPKPYELQASTSYFNSSVLDGKTTATISCTGTLVVTKTVEPVTVNTTVTTTTTEYVPGTSDEQVSVTLHWNTDGTNWLTNGLVQQGGYLYQQNPWGIQTYSDVNYDLRGTNWPYYGLMGTLSVNGGDRGASVVIVQKILNGLIFFGWLGGPYLAEDGVYGQTTANKVRAFQSSRGAYWIDGIVDGETWSLLGYALDAMSSVPGWSNPALNEWAYNARTMTRLAAISDGSTNTGYVRQSWFTNGPSTIRESFLIQFNEYLSIYQISVMPYLSNSATKTVAMDWLDIMPRDSLYRYGFNNGWPGPLGGLYGADGQWITVPLGSCWTNSVMFRLTQSGSAGFGGSTRLLGIRDVAVEAKKMVPGTPGYYKDVTTNVDVPVTTPGYTYEVPGIFTYNHAFEFSAGVMKILPPRTDDISAEDARYPCSQMRFDINSLTISPPEIAEFFTSRFVDKNTTTPEGILQSTNELELTYHGFDNAISDENFVEGPAIGGGDINFYTKNLNGQIDPYARSFGWITKEDGIKLICYADGRPFGFPTSLPSGLTTSMHFARYDINALNVDQTIHYGLYDVLRKEWITNTYGDPEISYYDYIRRGPQNVFMAVQTTYELDTSSNLPGTTDPVRRPFKWAMPVYGVVTGTKSKIQIEPLSPDLGVHDVWALPVKTGVFSRKIALSSKANSGSLGNYLKNYQGSTVTAYYTVPEAKSSAWSSLYGRPYTDVRGEIPIIIDDTVIKVRQNPILMVKNPTTNPSAADPWYPIFTVYKRRTLNDDWAEVPFSKIKDYDAWNGTITLVEPLNSNDARLIKIDYTSERKTFLLKHDGDNPINLNPFVTTKSEWLNKALYVYMLPEYVVDSHNIVIPESKITRTIKVTDNSSIFNPIQTDYDPTIVPLGIIYTSTAFDVNDLSILDTRKRGGGANFFFGDKELETIQPEFDSYLDVKPRRAASYQRGGLITVRLPAALRDDFSYEDVQRIIEKNLTIGVAYKIEDLQGNRWDQ